MTIFNLITLFGGLALFLYGMRLMGDGLKKGSSDAFKRAMEKVTNNPLVGFLLGLVVTAVIQSSTATIVLTSGLVGAGVMSLHQSIGVILGANVGTTITGQIIRLLDVNASETSLLNFFKPSTLAPLAAIIGILFLMAVKTRQSDTIGSIAMGFGILFTGLLSMTAAVSPLSESETFANMFYQLSGKPVLGFLLGAGVAFLLQSSSATIGILQAIATTGALTFSSVYAIIIGVNIGDCVTTAIVCSIGSKADAKRTGVIHILFNIAGSILVIVGLMLLHSFGVLDALWDEALSSGGIANVHTVFRLASAIVLLPVCCQFEKLSRKLVKDDVRLGENVDHELSLLDEKFFTSPAIALSGAGEAITTMARLARTGVMSAMGVLEQYDAHTIEVINENEEHIDKLADHVDNYLIRLSSRLYLWGCQGFCLAIRYLIFMPSSENIFSSVTMRSFSTAAPIFRASAVLPATPRATNTPASSTTSPPDSWTPVTFCSPRMASIFSGRTATSGGNSAASGAPFSRRVTLAATGKSACTSCRAYSPLPTTATSLPR